MQRRLLRAREKNLGRSTNEVLGVLAVTGRNTIAKDLREDSETALGSRRDEGDQPAVRARCRGLLRCPLQDRRDVPSIKELPLHCEREGERGVQRRRRQPNDRADLTESLAALVTAHLRAQTSRRMRMLSASRAFRWERRATVSTIVDLYLAYRMSNAQSSN